MTVIEKMGPEGQLQICTKTLDSKNTIQANKFQYHLLDLEKKISGLTPVIIHGKKNVAI